MTGPVRYKRNSAVSETELDGEIFLVEPETEEVFYLDAMSAGLWRLVAAPQFLGETVEVYHAPFPDADRQAAEIDVVFIKGFANAHTLYPDLALRIQGYLDILVRLTDFIRLVDFLVAQGFFCRAAENHPWVMISDASFLPFVLSDGASHIDIHVRPDSYPAHRSLSTELALADSQQVKSDGIEYRMPSDDRSLILCVTSAAKGKFNILSVGKVIDAIMVLKSARPPDWYRISSLARDGGLQLPLKVYFALLLGLGVAMGGRAMVPL